MTYNDLNHRKTTLLISQSNLTKKYIARFGGNTHTHTQNPNTERNKRK